MSLFGPHEETLAFFANVESVIGPGQVSEESQNGNPCYHLYGRHREHAIHVFVVTTGGVMLSIRFGIDLRGLPITLLLNHRKNTRIHGVPEVRTEDPAFDGVFLLNGFPATVLTEALDAPTRAWLLEQYTNREPTLETEAGEISLRVVVQQPLRNLARVMPADEAVYWMDALIPIADKLVSAFERQRAEIAKSQGPEAAERWRQQHVTAMDARATLRRKLRWLLYAVFVGMPLLGAAVFSTFMIVIVLRSQKPKPAPVAVLDLMREGAEASFQASAGQHVTFRTDLGLTEDQMLDRHESDTRDGVMSAVPQITLVGPNGSEKTLPCPFDGLGVMRSDSWTDQGNACSFVVEQSGTQRVRAKVRWPKLTPRSGTLEVVVGAVAR